MYIPRPDAASLIQTLIAEKVGPQRYKVWFKNATQVTISDGHIKVSTPNAFICSWVERHFSETIADAAREVTGKEHQVSFVVEVDGVHTIHLGDIGHLLSEEKLSDIGPVDIACVPLGGSLTPAKAAALIAQLDPRIVVPMPICDDDADCAETLKRFFHEMGAEAITQPKLSVTATSLPAETTTVLLESRGKLA